MKFSIKTREDIRRKLISGYDLFFNGSLGFLVENIKTYYRVGFENVSNKTMPFEVNLEYCINFLLDSKEDINNVVFDFKKGNGIHWWENEIVFPFSKRMPDRYEWGTPEFEVYLVWSKDFNYACEHEFWEVENNRQAYEVYSQLNIFDNKIFTSRELSYFQNKREYFFDKAVWFSYVKSLITTFFPDLTYSVNFSSKKMHRFLLQLKDDLWFGFEYSETEMSYQLNMGVPCLPDYLNLVLLNTSFSKTEKLAHYYYKHNSSILSLGILGNPFFYQPCFPMLGFSAVDVARNHERQTPYRDNIIQIGDGNYQIVYPSRYADSMKKHAFFYLSLLSSTSKIYVDYLITVLKNAI